jgi:hypothetical protein
MTLPLSAHPRESGDPGFFLKPCVEPITRKNAWIPAFAGTSGIFGISLK